MKPHKHTSVISYGEESRVNTSTISIYSTSNQVIVRLVDKNSYKTENLCRIWERLRESRRLLNLNILPDDRVATNYSNKMEFVNSMKRENIKDSKKVLEKLIRLEFPLTKDMVEFKDKYGLKLVV